MGAGALSRVRDGDYLCVLTSGGGGSAVGSSLHGRAGHHPVRHQLPTRGQPLARGGGRSTMGSASAVARGGADGYATTGGVGARRAKTQSFGISHGWQPRSWADRRRRIPKVIKTFDRNVHPGLSMVLSSLR